MQQFAYRIWGWFLKVLSCFCSPHWKAESGIWIGASDTKQEGNFMWTDSSKMDYKSKATTHVHVLLLPKQRELSLSQLQLKLDSLPTFYTLPQVYCFFCYFCFCSFFAPKLLHLGAILNEWTLTQIRRAKFQGLSFGYRPVITRATRKHLFHCNAIHLRKNDVNIDFCHEWTTIGLHEVALLLLQQLCWKISVSSLRWKLKK